MEGRSVQRVTLLQLIEEQIHAANTKVEQLEYLLTLFESLETAAKSEGEEKVQGENIQERMERFNADKAILKSELDVAVANLRSLKKKMNEEILDGIVDPLVEYLAASRKGAQSLKAWSEACTTTYQAVACNTHLLVYRFSEETMGSTLGEEVHKISRKFPNLNHVVAAMRWDSPHHISLEGAPGTLHTFEVSDRDGGGFGADGLTINLEELSLCPSLQVIRTVHCSNLRTVHNLRACSALRELCISECHLLSHKLLSDLVPCTGLQKLCLQYPGFGPDSSLVDYGVFQRMDSTAILSLSLKGVQGLRDVSSLSSYPALRTLCMETCSAVPSSAYQVLGACTGLHELELESCRQLEDFPSFQACINLRIMRLINIPVSDLSPLASCSGLSSLTMEQFYGLPNDAFRALGACTGLQELTLLSCELLTEMPNFQTCARLESITIGDCQNLTNISTLATCPAVRMLEISQCVAVSCASFKAFAGSASLQNLYLTGCDQLLAVPDLKRCPTLEEIHLVCCDPLRNMDNLSACKALKVLAVDSIDSLRNGAFKALGSCTGLQDLRISGCEKLRVIPDLTACSKLASIQIAWCDRLVDIAALAGCQSLSHITIKFCRALSDDAFQAVGACLGLESLVFTSVKGLHTLPNFQACTQLKDIRLNKCVHLTDISALASCPSLRVLMTEGCTALPSEALKALEACTGLQELVVEGCGQVCGFRNLAALTRQQPTAQTEKGPSPCLTKTAHELQLLIEAEQERLAQATSYKPGTARAQSASRAGAPVNSQASS